MSFYYNKYLFVIFYRSVASGVAVIGFLPTFQQCCVCVETNPAKSEWMVKWNRPIPVHRSTVFKIVKVSVVLILLYQLYAFK